LAIEIKGTKEIILLIFSRFVSKKGTMRNNAFLLSVIFLILTTGCNKTVVPTIEPTVSTLATENSQTSATVGGLLDPGKNGSSNPITERGVYWSITKNPKETGKKIACGLGIDVYSKTLSGLTANTTYYVIAYATNSVGSSYGEEVSFTTHSIKDIDGNDYDIVTIGDQLWMKDNLLVTKLNDGTELLKAIKPESTQSDFAYFENEYFIDYISNSGRFYNYNIAKSKKICPIGWHVPSDDEWTTLGTSLGGMDIAGGKLKNISGWESPNTGSTNESGFSALPKTCTIVRPVFASSGGNQPLTYFFDGRLEAIWWSSDYNFWRLEYKSASLLYKRSSIPDSQDIKDYQFLRSIRCVKD
jgi:uncharacterized protein (TIGR02145 family)